MVHIKEIPEPPASSDKAMTMESVFENNPSLKLRPGTPIPVKSLVPTPKHLGKVQKIFKHQTHLN